MAKFFALTVPDDNTLAVLQHGLNGWLQDPRTFWIRPGATSTASQIPPIEIVRSYIQTERDDA